MDSIIQTEKECYICKRTTELHRHHIVYGNPGRKNSERYGLTVYLCREHHTGNTGVHFNRQMDLYLKRTAQTEFEKQHKRSEWMQVFGRNYLE